MDDNDKSLAYGVSHVDGVTPVVIRFDATRKMLLDYTTTIQFPASLYTAGNRYYPLAEATSSVNNKTVMPWVVNSSTGAVLASLT